MPDFRIADSAPEHQKMRSAGPAAIGIWSMAGAYSMKEGTDGWVPTYWVQTWPSGAKHAATLVKVGLWEREERHGLPGFRFHDFEDYQRSAQRVEDAKRAARERWIPFELRSLVMKRDGYRCAQCGNTERLSLDHIKPVSKGGLSTEKNLQVLCLPCNLRKGARLA